MSISSATVQRYASQPIIFEAVAQSREASPVHIYQQ
jgi:hypothetical protein